MTRKRSSTAGKEGIHWRVAKLAARQHGVVSRSQLRALGVSDTAIDHDAATGRLHPIFPAVYSLGLPVGREARILAAVLACGEGAVVSHDSAAALLGLRDQMPTVIHLIAPRQLGRKIPGIRRHYVPHPAQGEAIMVNGIPCTSVSRTVVDLAGGLGATSLRRVLERAAFLGKLNVAGIDAALARHRRRGAPLLRAILEDWRPVSRPHRLRSTLEARLLSFLAARNLPTPLCNHKLKVGDREIEVDFFWPKQRVVVEGDGRAAHSHEVAFERDRERDLDLTVAGYHTHRVTWKQLEKDPDKTLAAIAGLLRARAPARDQQGPGA
jgi:very-short-patch-repair endonuclease